MNIEPVETSNLPPLPDGVYLARLVERETRDSKFDYMTTDSGRRVAFACIEARIVRPIFSDRPVPEHADVLHWVDTVPDWQRPNRRSSLTRVLLALGIDPERLTSVRERANVLRELLENHPLVIIETKWQAYSPTEKRKVLSGMSKFPLLPNGERAHHILYNGEELAARAKILEFRRASDEGQILKARRFAEKYFGAINAAATSTNNQFSMPEDSGQKGTTMNERITP